MYFILAHKRKIFALTLLMMILFSSLFLFFSFNVDIVLAQPRGGLGGQDSAADFIPGVGSVRQAQSEVEKQGLVACEGAEDCGYIALLNTLGNVITFLLQLATGVAVIVIAWAGFLYMTAAGNPGNISQAHKMIWYAVIGFLIALAAWLIVEAILNTFGVNDPTIRQAV